MVTLPWGVGKQTWAPGLMIWVECRLSLSVRATLIGSIVSFRTWLLCCWPIVVLELLDTAKIQIGFVAHTHCTGPGIGQGPGMGQGTVCLYIMPLTVHDTQGQGQ